MQKSSSAPKFINLHVHSAYSLLEGALPLGKLIDMAIADNQPALGLCDSGNLFGAQEFSEKAAKKGLQPIIGCALNLDFGIKDPTKPYETKLTLSGSLVLVAQTEEGFGNLSKLVTSSFLDTSAGDLPHIKFSALTDKTCSGLICLTGGPRGPINNDLNQEDAGRADIKKAAEKLESLKQLFPDRLYVELQRHGSSGEKAVERQLIDLAYEYDLPLVATNEPFFPKESDFEAQDALLAIADGTVIAQTERRKLTPEHRFKTCREMAKVFEDLPEAVENTIEIAQRVSYRPEERAPILPRFAASTDLSDEEAVLAEGEALAKLARQGLTSVLEKSGLAPGLDAQAYWDRLEFELNVITSMKFPGYFLIVADFIRWAKSREIPVGPGRGSGAGSVVAWALTITNIDPLRYELLFERFLNPERVSMPDFDIDFCQERRDEVIRYVQDKYGFAQVAQIITFGSLQARAALRDVGRVLQMPYSQVDGIAKLIPSNPANPVSLGEAIKEEPRLQAARDEDENVAQLLTIAQKLEGLYRHASTHAAGIVIGDRPLQELVPLYRDPRSEIPVTQYSMKWAENAGLVKFDFLGLKTLTTIDKTIALLAKRGIIIDIDSIPIDDEKTYQLYQSGETVGVFQVESAGMRRVLLDLLPDRFEDIIALVALYRPGPMDNIPSFCNRKHGRETPNYMHDLLEPVLKETFGIIVYQEQVMQIAQVLSGYSLGKADVLRRAMGKKIRAEMVAQKSDFINGAVANNVEKKQADSIFDLVTKFADYGFNKSHAAAYALVSYQTAYLKANYPAEFIAASMTLDMGNTDKLNDFRRDARRLGIEVLTPSVNLSSEEFDVVDGKITYAISAIKGIGRAVAEHIVSLRKDGHFADIRDFTRRIDPSVFSRRTMETLTNAGAFDCLTDTREQMFAAIETIIATAQRRASDDAVGNIDMFAGGSQDDIILPVVVDTWMPAERLNREFAAIGFYLAAHPLDEYQDILESLRVQKWGDFERAVKTGTVSAGRLAGTIASKQERRTRKGTPMAVVIFSDPTGQFECVMFSEQITQFGSVLEAGNSVVVEVLAEDQPDGVRLRLQKATMLSEAAQRSQKKLQIFAENTDCLVHLKSTLREKGEGEISIILLDRKNGREIELTLPGGYRVTPELRGALKSLPGVTMVEIA